MRTRIQYRRLVPAVLAASTLYLDPVVRAAEVGALDNTAEGALPKVRLYSNITHESNLFLNSGDEAADTYLTAGAGIEYERKGGLLDGGVRAHYEREFYDRYNELDGNLYGVSPYLSLHDNAWTLRLDGSRQTAHSAIDTGTGVQRVQETTTTGGTANLNVDLGGPWSTDVGGHYTRTEYKGIQRFDFDEAGADAALKYAVSDRLDVGAKAAALSRDYLQDQRPDSKIVRATGLVNYALTGKIDVGLETGAEYVDFADNAPVAVGTAGSATNWFAKGKATYTPDTKWRLTADVGRGVENSYKATSNYVTRTDAGLSLAYLPTERLEITNGLRFGLNDEGDEASADSRQTTYTLEVAYKVMKYARLQGRYEAVNYDSTDDGSDYMNNVVMGGITVEF